MHARGASAKGYFEVTHDITDLSCADVFRAVGAKTPVIARFSTVIHERGSPETLRDPRGFAVKFYTREGNWDLVGNNIPVFFIRDGFKFPDMVHCLKPNPVSHIQEGWRIADFFSSVPESMHMFTWLFDDHGIPKDYRHMPGFGVNAFVMVNAQGKRTLVKFHWVPHQPIEYLVGEDVVKVGGSNHSHATEDLFRAIERGDYPAWDLKVQTIEIEDQDKYEFDPLDDTKIWPEDRFPLRPIGTMVLNKNPDNFHLENEMLAFCPGVVPPGIELSDDKMIQARAFSYSDTQRYRLGINYLLLPPNAPKTQYHNNHFDGAMNFTIRKSEIDYFPSRIDPTTAAPKPPVGRQLVQGEKTRAVIPKENNFQQPGERYRSFDDARKKRFIATMTGPDLLGHPRTPVQVRKIWIGYLAQADAQLGEAIATALRNKGLL